MTKFARTVVIAALIAMVALVIALKDRRPTSTRNGSDAGGDARGAPAGSSPSGQPGLPRLVDLGADRCVPCKLMAPILEELKTEYAGKMEVIFIDVWKNPEAGKEYDIKIIPTQIFYDASGEERFRHEGFLSREDILARWKEVGVDLEAARAARDPPARSSPGP